MLAVVLPRAVRPTVKYTTLLQGWIQSKRTLMHAKVDTVSDVVRCAISKISVSPCTSSNHHTSPCVTIGCGTIAHKAVRQRRGFCRGLSTPLRCACVFAVNGVASYLRTWRLLEQLDQKQHGGCFRFCG